MLAFLERMGRKFIGASLASGVILLGFLFIALTGKGLQSFAEFTNSIAMVYGIFAGSNAAATFATAKAEASKAKTPKKAPANDAGDEGEA